MGEVKPTAESGTISYYLNDYSDEVVPCDCSLEGWAHWLSKPDPDWGRYSAASDGDTFKASHNMRWGDDVVVSHGANGWIIPDVPGDAVFLAIRHAPGLGWDVDHIVATIGGLIDCLAEFEGEETPLHVAVGFSSPAVMLTYRADPPRLELAPLQ